MNRDTMTPILIKCHECNCQMSIELDDIAVVSPAEVIQFFATNRIHLFCDKCQECDHEFDMED